MTSLVQTAERPAASPEVSAAAEAARYALLRRLAPSMRHHLVVNLQPIGMIYEVMDRRLRAAEPNLAEVHDSAQKINGFARAALASSIDVVSWLAPQDEVMVAPADGVRECLGLITTSLTFRGYAVRNEVTPVAGKVRRAAMRNVFTGALIHATDQNAAPSDLVVTADAIGSELVMTLTLRPTEGDQGFAPEQPYRPLSPGDLDALAAAENVKVTRTGTQVLRLAFPLVSSA
ncbi:MAG: hypothetical protein ACAH21_02115 [Ramlibacter sp.]|nr:hypothetical protein [Ramlibacter sp.]